MGKSEKDFAEEMRLGSTLEDFVTIRRDILDAVVCAPTDSYLVVKKLQMRIVKTQRGKTFP